jgi:toluene monooxygenase electron transfer component
MDYTIRIEGGESFVVSADEPNLLRGALRAGVGFPHECSVGGCGGCRFELVEGEMATLWEQAPGLSERDRRKGKRLACQCRPQSDCTVKVRVGDEYKPPVPARRQSVSLVSRRQLTSDTAEFTFAAEMPAAFRPGQYALLELPGVAGARAYSMSNLANGEGRWQFIIRRVPGGAGTGFLFESLQAGGRLVLDGPYGMGWWRPDSHRETVCIAGGSGLAPMLSIARSALGRSRGRLLHFFYGVRTPADLCAEEMLATLPGASGGRLRFHPVVSENVPDEAWSGRRGFVHEALAEALPLPPADYEYYFAGPPPMIEAVQRLLMIERQVPYQQIHFDRFV